MNKARTLFIDKTLFEYSPYRYTQMITQVEPFDTLEMDEIREQLNNNVYFSVTISGDDVACVCRTAKVDGHKHTYINRPIVTADEFRRLGFASACLKASEKFLRYIGCRKLISFVDVENIESYNLHTKMGYCPVEVGEEYKDSKYCWDTAIMFEKVLSRTKIDENVIDR